MKNYQKLKQIIQRANSEIMEFKFGCEVLQEKELIDWAKMTTLLAYNEKNGIAYYRELDGSVFFKRGTKNIKILGRPIRLADVLLAIGKNSKCVFLHQDNSQATFLKVDNQIQTPVAIWNLKDDNLDHQSKPTKDWLEDLLVKK